MFEPLFNACKDLAEDQEEYAGFMFGWLLRRAISS